MTAEPIQQSQLYHEVREYLLHEFLPGEDPSLLTETTSLISGGILDSIGITRLVTHLEGRYSVRFESEEITVDNLDTMLLIVSAIERKLNSKQN